MDFIAVDFETANSNRSSICSVGLAIVKNGKLKETKHFLVKPTPNHYDGINMMIHGITDRHTRKEKTFKQLWKELKPYFHNQTIVAHNAAFDCSALRYALESSNLAFPELDYHCTWRLSEIGLDLPDYKLDTVSEHFNIELDHHNAVSDAKASALIALELCKINNVKSLDELSSNFGFKVGRIIKSSKTYKPFSKRR